MTNTINTLQSAIVNAMADTSSTYTGASINEIKTFSGVVVDAYTENERKAVKLAQMASQAGAQALLALRLVQIENKHETDKDTAVRLHTLSVVTAASGKGDVIAIKTLQNYFALLNRANKLGYDITQFDGGIVALNNHLKSLATQKEAEEEGITLEELAASKQAKKADKVQGTKLQIEASEAATKYEEAKADKDKAEQAAQVMAQELTQANTLLENADNVRLILRDTVKDLELLEWQGRAMMVWSLLITSMMSEENKQLRSQVELLTLPVVTKTKKVA